MRNFEVILVNVIRNGLSAVSHLLSGGIDQGLHRLDLPVLSDVSRFVHLALLVVLRGCFQDLFDLLPLERCSFL